MTLKIHTIYRILLSREMKSKKKNKIKKK